MPIAEIDKAGARANSLAENREEIFEALKGDFGEDLSESPQTPQAQIAGIQALRDTEIGEMLVKSATSGSSLDHAEGTGLEAMGSLMGVRRFQAARSKVTATVRGSSGTVLNKGVLARTANGDLFRSTEEVTLISGTGVEVEYEAVEEGPIACPAGELTRIITIVVGWDTITNVRQRRWAE